MSTLCGRHNGLQLRRVDSTGIGRSLGFLPYNLSPLFAQYKVQIVFDIDKITLSTHIRKNVLTVGLKIAYF